MSEAKQLQNLNAKLATLERRYEHLGAQLEGGRFSASSRSFVEAERTALEGAMLAMRLHHAKVEGLPQPASALRELVDYLERQPKGEPALQRLLERASFALVEFDALG